MYAGWYVWLLNVRSMYRFLLTYTTVIAVFLGWLFFLYIPMHKYVEQLSSDIKQRKKDVDTCTLQEAACQNLSQQMQQLKKDVGLDCESLDQSLQHSLAAIVHEVEQLGLQLVSLKKERQNKKDWYTTAYVELEVLGSLAEIVHFLQTMAENKLLVQCDNMLLQLQQDEQFLLYCQLKFFMPSQLF
jgi:Tfp pilus assembly protein PilO